MKCDVCNSNETYIKEYEHNYIVKDKKIKFNANRRFCSKCNSLIYDEQLDNEASKFAIAKYNEIYGIDKGKIIEFRRKYYLSLELLAKIIGCAKKTLISYEQGNSIPNDIYLINLKMLINNPELVMTYVKNNPSKFNDKEYKKLSNTFELNNLNEYNGYTELSIEKIENSILYFSENSISKTKLLKELFYSDFYYYKNNVSSITGLEYAKFKYGPVPNNYESMLEDMQLKGFISYVIDFNGDYETHTITANKPVDIKVFNDKEFMTLNKIRDFFKEYTSNSIANYSHQEKAWLMTPDKQKISYNHAVELKDI